MTSVLIFSLMSRVAFSAGSPAEMYMNGVQYWICNTAFIVILPVVATLFLPIFYRCGVTSVYEYLQYR